MWKYAQRQPPKQSDILHCKEARAERQLPASSGQMVITTTLQLSLVAGDS